MAEHGEEIVVVLPPVDGGLCSCGHHVLDHGYIDDGNGWEASPCRLCTCLDSDWGEPSFSFRDEARKALGRALDESLLRSDLATRCRWCGCRLDTCRPLREHQRKCCPDCTHMDGETHDA